MTDEVIGLLQQEWKVIDGLCSGLDEPQWKTPTDCPGWDVKDQLSHIIGIESWLLGRPPVDHKVGDAPHVKNPLGQLNEIEVDLRRGRAPAEVLSEFRDVTGQRIAQLATLTDEELDQPSGVAILGNRPLRQFLGIRLFDCWTHEQDIRRAVGAHGHLEGPVARRVRDACASAMGMVVAKKAGSPDGTTVVFDISGAEPKTFAVGVQDGRGGSLDDAPPSSTVRIEMDLQTFHALSTGRWDPERALKGGRVGVSGDEELAGRILQEMTFVS